MNEFIQTLELELKNNSNTKISQDFQNKAVVLMSSGNYGGLDFKEIKTLIN